MSAECLCQAVDAAGVLVEIFLGGGFGFGRGVVPDDFENGGVIGEASADGPVAAVDDAVFAEGVPERVERGAIEFHIRRRGVFATCAFREGGDFHKDILMRRNHSNAFEPFGIGSGVCDTDPGAVIDDDAEIGNVGGDLGNAGDLVRTAEEIEGEIAIGEELEIADEI